jgi:UDP-N-acetylglucosamine 4,6-dehydratase
MIEDGAKELPITDARMTRFWITLPEGVDMVLKSFKRMHGGEIFVPKIPSAYITDLAKAMAPELPIKVIGIRPGEKLHEIMCPVDNAHQTIEFSDHYVICPAITFISESNYKINANGESAQSVKLDFEYSSGTNPHFLSLPQLKELNENCES